MDQMKFYNLKTWLLDCLFGFIEAFVIIIDFFIDLMIVIAKKIPFLRTDNKGSVNHSLGEHFANAYRPDIPSPQTKTYADGGIPSGDPGNLGQLVERMDKTADSLRGAKY